MTDTVNVGTAANAGNGDPLRTAFAQINRRFTELALYSRGDWAPATAYTATPRREWVMNDGTAYVAVVNHTSGGSFATDLAAGKWLALDVAQLIADLAAPGGSAVVGYKEGTVQDKLGECISFFDAFDADMRADAMLASPVLDHTAAMQSIIDAAEDGTTIYGKSGATFKFTNLLCTKSIKIDFDGSNLIVDPTPAGVTTGTPAIRFLGSRSATGYSVNSKSDFGAIFTLTASGDSSNFAADDWVVVEDNAAIQKWDASGVAYNGRGQIARIKSVSSGVVTLSQQSEHLYEGATAKIYKVTPLIGPKVYNVGKITEIDPGGVTTGSVEIGAPHLFEFAYCVNPKISSVYSSGWNLFAVHFAYCVNASQKRLVAVDPFRPSNGGHGYMVRFYRCSGGVAQLSRAERCRHAVDFANTYDSVSRDNVSVDPVGVSYLAHGLASRRCKSKNDTVLAPSVYVSDTGGWGVGNGTFSADYDFEIDSPTYRGGSEAVTSYALSDGLKITSPDFVISDSSGAAVRGVIVGYGAKNVSISGGVIDMSGCSNAASHSVLSRDNAPVLTGDVTVNGTRFVPASSGAGPVYAAQTGGGISAVNCVVDGDGSNAFETALTQTHVHFVGNAIFGTWSKGFRVANAPTSSYVITGNIDAGTVTSFLDVASSSLLVNLFNGRSAQTIRLNGAAGTNRGVELQTAGVARWSLRANGTAESGSNVGSDFEIIRRTDAGGAIAQAMVLYRATGRLDIEAGGAWNVPLKIGTYYLFVSTDGKLRIKASFLPTSDTDGTVVGTQT